MVNRQFIIESKLNKNSNA